MSQSEDYKQNSSQGSVWVEDLSDAWWAWTDAVLLALTAFVAGASVHRRVRCISVL